METALARIERLERNNRRMLIALVALVALFGAAFGLVRSAGTHLRANSVTIVDGNGRQRILVGGAARGGVITLNDAHDTARIGMVALRDLAGVRLFSAAQEQVASLETSDTTALYLRGNQRKSLVFFGLIGPVPGISMLGPGGIAKISVAGGYGASLIESDANRSERLAFGSTADGQFQGYIEGQTAGTTDYQMP